MFLRLKAAKRYFSLVELMVVIALFSFFIVILTQFLLKATELWRYTESETEINVQAQTIFATMDNLFEQAIIPDKLPSSPNSEAVYGFAVDLQVNPGTSDTGYTAYYYLDPIPYDPDDNEKWYENAPVLVFPVASEMRLGKAESTNFYIAAIMRNAKDQLVLRTIGDKGFDSTTDGLKNLLAADHDNLLKAFRGDPDSDISLSSGGSGAGSGTYTDSLIQVIADNVTQFTVYPLIAILSKEGSDLDAYDKFGLIPVSPVPNTTSAEYQLMGVQVEFSLLSRDDYDTWNSMWGDRENKPEPDAAKSFRRLHEKTFSRIFVLR